MNLTQSSAILLSQRAALTPDREALLLTDSGDRFSYGELDERANCCANWLLSLGIDYGDTVSILAQNGIAYLDLFFGCARIGAVFAPLNWRLVAAELSYIVNDCQSQLLLYGPEYVEVREALAATTAIPHQFSLAEYEAALAMAEPGPPPVDERIGPESIHCILYTSGTTGRPKGALISARQVVWNCINTVVSWGLTADDVSPVFTPMFHAGGLFAFLTPIFYAGGRILLSRAFDPEATLEQIEREGCTVILGVPTLFQLWLKSPQLARTDFSRVRYFISGGAPCPVPLMQAWRAATGTVFRQGYGLSEVGPNCFSMTDDESEPKSGSVGKPIFHSQMRLVDENGRDVPTGEIGELIIKGPHVCSGYLNNPEATAAALRDGWFHTGDMARRDGDGFFYISGRFKDMIISGGENVYAAEVEAVFLTHPQVAECALIGKPDEKWGEIGLMLVVPAGSEQDADALLAHCGERLARYKIPKEIQFVDSLPYSPYGKVEKVKLRAQYL